MDSQSKIPENNDVGLYKETITKKLVGDMYELHLERHQLANGKSFDYYVFHLPHFAVIIPITADQKFVLIKQYRPSWRRVVVEFPAGVADTYQEEPENTAKRELEEETGFYAEKMTLLGKFRHSSRSTQYCYAFVAENLELRQQNLDEGEFIEEILFLSAKEIDQMIEKEEMIDISHIASWYSYKESIKDKKLK